MNKIPDYLIDSICAQIKDTTNVGGKDVQQKLDIIINDTKKMNDGKIPRKVEILLEPLKPTEKVVVEKEIEEGFNFGRLYKLSKEDLSHMSSTDLSDLVNSLSKSFYDHKLKVVSNG